MKGASDDNVDLVQGRKRERASDMVVDRRRLHGRFVALLPLSPQRDPRGGGEQLPRHAAGARARVRAGDGLQARVQRGLVRAALCPDPAGGSVRRLPVRRLRSSGKARGRGPRHARQPLHLRDGHARAVEPAAGRRRRPGRGPPARRLPLYRAREPAHRPLRRRGPAGAHGARPVGAARRGAQALGRREPRTDVPRRGVGRRGPGVRRALAGQGRKRADRGIVLDTSGGDVLADRSRCDSRAGSGRRPRRKTSSSRRGTPSTGADREGSCGSFIRTPI
jgi:hypothetical protein